MCLANKLCYSFYFTSEVGLCISLNVRGGKLEAGGGIISFLFVAGMGWLGLLGICIEGEIRLAPCARNGG